VTPARRRAEPAGVRIPAELAGPVEVALARTSYLILLGVGLVLACLFGINDRTMPTQGLNSNTRLIINLLVVPMVTLLLLNRTPWMPRESLELSGDPGGLVVGYVLSTANDQVAVWSTHPEGFATFLPRR
jgi:hypothetical protein